MYDCTLIPVTSTRQHSLSDWYVLRFFSTWKIPSLECAVSQNWYFCKWKSLLKKLIMQAHHSCLPFYCKSLEKQFWKGILGRESHCIMITDKFRTLSNICHGAFVRKMSTIKSCCLFLQKSLSQMLGWVLNTPLMMTVARCWESISNKTKNI